MNVRDILDVSVNNFSENVFVFENDKRLTYKELDSCAKQVSSQISCKYRKTLIALLMENSIDYLACYFGIMISGNIVVPVNKNANVDELMNLVQQGVQVIFTHDKNIKEIKKLPSEVLAKLDIIVVNSDIENSLFTNLYVDSKVEVKDYEELLIDDEDIAQVIFTSGTKASANGVCLTHKNLLSNMQQIINEIAISEKDNMLVIIPFYYSYGNSLILTHLARGASLTINKNSMLPMFIINDLKKYKCTSLAGVASNFILLLKRSNFVNDMPQNLRYITLAGEPVPDWILHSLLKKNLDIYVMYGQTEASARITIMQPDDLPEKLGSVGKALEGEVIHIVDQDNKILPVGSYGEVIVSGPNIMKGYLNRDEYTHEKIIDGFSHTGDFGRLDSNGYLYIDGRIDDMIKVGGERVFPIEIEKTILAMNQVKEVGVTGISNDSSEISSYLGQSIYAFVVTEADLEEKDILAYCKEHLPKHKIPERVIFVKELTRTKTGKLRRGSLKDLL